MTVFNARALASLVTVAGNALSKRLTVILGALIKVVEEEKDEELLAALDEALRALLASIEDPEGLNTLMLLLLGWYTYSVLIARSFLICDGQDKRRRADASGERLRSVCHVLRRIRPRCVFVPRGLGETADLTI